MASDKRQASATALLLSTLFIICTAVTAFTPSTLWQPVVIPRSGAAASSSATRLHSSTATLPEGLTKTVTRPGSGPALQFGDFATVKYSCSVPGSPPFAKASRQKVVVGDGVMIRGWEAALQTMEVGEKATVVITDADRFGYGAEGVPPFVPPGAQIEMEMEILDAEEGGDLSSLATSDPLKPRTPGAIAAAYKSRQDQALIDEADKKDGIEGLIERAKSFYFFGFFEGETGQQAPWYLRPSITFPIAFLVVGLAFYVSYSTGGIYERGGQVTDELDEIIVSSLGGSGALGQSLVLALAAMSGAEF